MFLFVIILKRSHQTLQVRILLEGKDPVAAQHAVSSNVFYQYLHKQHPQPKSMSVFVNSDLPPSQVNCFI